MEDVLDMSKENLAALKEERRIKKITRERNVNCVIFSLLQQGHFFTSPHLFLLVCVILSIQHILYPSN